MDDDILKMAQEAGLLYTSETSAEWFAPRPKSDYPLRLKAFADLVRADERERIKAEPVAWAFRHSDGTYHDPSVTEHSAGMVPLYPPPPQRKPLTDEEIKRLWYDNGAGIELSRFSSIARAVERALEEEKNRGR